MTSYIADSRNIVFQRTKNIPLQDIIDIAHLIALVNIAGPMGRCWNLFGSES